MRHLEPPTYARVSKRVSSGAVARYYQGGRGSGPASQPREAAASEVAAVSGGSTWTPKGDREGHYPVVLGRLYAALRVGVMLHVHHSFWRVGSPYNEEMQTMETLTLTLHKTKDTKNKVVYGTKDGEVIQSVYIDKDALGDVPPATLQVVISAQ